MIHPNIRRSWPRRFNFLRLEDRITPAITTTWDPAYGALSVSCDGADSISLGTNSDRRVTVNGTAVVDSSLLTIESRLVQSITINGGSGGNVIDLSDVGPIAFSAIEFKPVRVDLKRAADATTGKNIRKDITVKLRIDGGGGADTITGSQFADLIDCFEGADQIDGGLGDDVIWIRNDDFTPVTINGGSGANTLIVDYTQQVGATMAVTADIGIGSSTISYGLKQCVEKDTTVMLADQDYNLLTLVNSSPLPGGGTVDISSRSATDTLIEISSNGLKKKFDWAPKLEGGKEGLAVALGNTLNGYEVRIDAGSAPVSVDNTGTGNSLVVNTFGLGSTTTPTAVLVTGMAPITFSGIGLVSTEVRLYDAVAWADLKALGVIISPTVTVGPDGKQRLALSVSNNSTITGLKTEWITSINSPKITPKIAKESHGRFSAAGRISGLKTDTEVAVDFHDGVLSLPATHLAAGMPWSQEVTVTMPPLGPGQSSINEVHILGVKQKQWLVNNYVTRVHASIGGKNYDIDIAAYFETGDKPTASQFAAVIDSDLGVTPSGGPTTLIGTDASGLIALVSSSAAGIDSDITTLTAGAHLYAGQQMVDVAPDGTTSGNAPATVAEMSLDGRFVVFESAATNLVAGLIDTNGTSDIFVRDMVLGKTFCLSAFTDTFGATSTGNGASIDPHISGDGDMVVFRSAATTLVTGLTDSNGEFDIFASKNIREIAIDELNIECVSIVPGMVPSQTCDKGIVAVDLNGDAIRGYTIAYLTEATNTGSGSNTGMQILGKESKSLSFSMKQKIVMAPSGTARLAVAGDGGTVVLWTDADVSSLVGIPDTNGATDIVRIKVEIGAAGHCSPVSGNQLGTSMGDGPSPAHAGEAPAVSVDGSMIAFTSTASNLISGLLSPATDGLYRYILRAGAPVRMDRIDTVGASSWGGDNHDPSISADGVTIAWSSHSDYQAGGPVFTKLQTWVKDCYDGKEVRRRSVLVSVTPSDGPSDGDSHRAIMARTGEYVLLSSAATNIVAGDTNGQTDVFASSLHETYRFQLAATDPADVTLQYDALTDSYQIVNTLGGGVVTELKASDGKKHFEITSKWQSTSLRTITINMDSGLQRLGGQIMVHGDTGNESVVVVGATSMAEVEMSGGSDHVSTLSAYRHSGTATFSDGTTRDVTERVMAVQCADVEELVNELPADRVNVHEFTHTLQATVKSTGFVRHTEFEGGGTGLKDLSTSPNTIYTLILTAGNDTCTIDTSGLTASSPENLIVDGNGGSDSITHAGALNSPPRIFILLPSAGPSLTPAVATGSASDDTISVGFGPFTLNGGAGNDIYEMGVKSTGGIIPVEYLLLDSSGDDAMVFSSSTGPVTVDLDNSAVQSMAMGATLQLSGAIEHVVGSTFDDTFTAKAIAVPRSLDGGREVSSIGDTLIVDAEGKAATIFGGQVHVAGKAPISYTNFEHVTVINNAPTLQVAAVEINDDDMQRSMVTKIVVGFNSLVTFPNGASSAITITDNSNGLPVACMVTPIDADGFTHAVITFPAGAPNYGSLPNGAFTLHVLASEVSSPLSPLDGNADGVVGPAGEDYATPTTLIFRTFGDANGDRVTNLADFSLFRGAFNLGPSVIFDLDGDGNVGLFDFGAFRGRFNILV